MKRRRVRTLEIFTRGYQCSRAEKCTRKSKESASRCIFVFIKRCTQRHTNFISNRERAALNASEKARGNNLIFTSRGSRMLLKLALCSAFPALPFTLCRRTKSPPHHGSSLFALRHSRASEPFSFIFSNSHSLINLFPSLSLSFSVRGPKTMF